MRLIDRTVTVTANPEFVANMLADDYANWTPEGAAQACIAMEEIHGDLREFDRVMMRCYWTEYNNAVEALADYDYADLTEMRDHTIVVEVSNGHILVLEH